MLARFKQTLRLFAPGILIAATGVGSGDLITAAFGGSKLTAGIAWAALVGSLLKWTLNEGLARWQMATNTTLLEGWQDHLGRWFRYVFFGYLLLWSFVTGGAMVNACGVAGYALWPIVDNPAQSKIIWGIIHSAAGLLLVYFGGFKLFEKMMGVCIAIMFCTVMVTAILIASDSSTWTQLFTFKFPTAPGDRRWMIGILGGVGGTVTLLSYGYWIREAGRTGREGVRTCRLDLAAGYLMTGLFGVAMILIGSRLTLSGKGDTVALLLAEQLETALGSAGSFARWAFLLGFWGAVFSSLLGVWQSTPYFFTDLALLGRRHSAAERQTVVYEKTPVYRATLFAMSVIPLILLWRPIAEIQLAYTVLGAFFMPLLALTLLLLNNSRRLPAEFRSSPWINAILFLTLAFFGYQGALEIIEAISRI